MRNFLRKTRTLLSVFSLVATMGVFSPQEMTAQTYDYIWVGGGGDVLVNFNTLLNWADGKIPGTASSHYLFDETVSGYYGPSNVDIYHITANTLTFGLNAGAYVIGEAPGGDYPIYLTRRASGGTPSSVIINLSKHNQVFNAPLGFWTELVSTLPINTGYAGITLAGGVQAPTTTGTVEIWKRGSGDLTFMGSNYLNFVRIDQGGIVLDAREWLELSLKTTLSWNGGRSIIVLGNATTETQLDMGTLGYWSTNAPANAARFRVEDNGVDETRLVFTSLGGRPTPAARSTVNFDLGEKSVIHFGSIATNSMDGIGVAFWLTATTRSGEDVRTGFVQLVGDSTDGYDVTRYTGQIALPGAQSGLVANSHYYVDGNHTMTGSSAAANGPATLTLRGTGTLSVTGGALYSPNILLEEGTGDYTLSVPGHDLRWDRSGLTAVHQVRAGMLTIHQYRTTGDLILAPKSIVATNLITTGPGTVRYQAGSATTTTLDVQEGRLQLESNALTLVTAAYVQAGTLGGSGQLGSTTVATTVQVFWGGQLDATPTTHITEEGVRGLQIYGKIQFDAESALSMRLTSDVMNGNYTPLHVTQSASSEDPTVTIASALDHGLGVDLRLSLEAPMQGTGLIVLLSTDGTIAGKFTSINGEVFGPDDHFILSYAGMDYDAFLSYNYNLGEGMYGIVIHTIPEPGMVVLLFGLTCVGWVYVRRHMSRGV
jgi:hypothetical protein